MNAFTNASHFSARSAARLASSLGPDMANALGLYADQVFKGEKFNFRIERIHNDAGLDLLNLRTNGYLQLRNQQTGELERPTIPWLVESYAKGELSALGDTIPGIHQDLAELDPIEPDKPLTKKRWARMLASRAICDGIKRSDKACSEWLDAVFGSEPHDEDHPRPAPSSLRRWMSRIDRRRNRLWALEPRVGRKRGRSQLPPEIDMLVTEAALHYYSAPRVKQVEAEAYLHTQIRKLNAERPLGTALFKKPSAETLRKRIQRLRCYDTLKSKYGDQQASKMLEGSGEPIRVEQFLQYVLMDAAALEQGIVFDENWPLPATKVWVTLLMDVFSRAILGASIYAGRPRHETSAQAIISCMVPPEVHPEMLALYPDLINMFGKPAIITPDNEKGLVGPTSAPALNDAGITLMLAPVEMPTAKAVLERFISTLKRALAGLPGTVIDPKRALELGYDAVGDMALTLPQIRSVVWQAINAHNVSPAAGLGGRSPLQVVMQSGHRRATPAFEDIGAVSRALGRSFHATMTVNGIELDGIRYREKALVSRFLANNIGLQKVRKTSGFSRVAIPCRVRRNDGNLYSIQVYCPVDEVWFTLPSTQPEYTNELSAWEHHEFTKLAKRRNEKFVTEDDRLKSRAITMRLIGELAPKLKFQQRRNLANLYISEQVRKISGASMPVSMPDDLPTVVAPQVVPDTGRLDSGITAPLPPAKSQSKAKEADTLPPAQPAAPTAQNVDVHFDWDAIEVDADPEVGGDDPVALTARGFDISEDDA